MKIASFAITEFPFLASTALVADHFSILIQNGER